jgi:hypothetical protein
LFRKLESPPEVPELSKEVGPPPSKIDPFPPAPTFTTTVLNPVRSTELMSRKPPPPPPAPTHAPPPPPPPTIKTRAEVIPAGTDQLHVVAEVNVRTVYPPEDVLDGEQAGCNTVRAKVAVEVPDEFVAVIV